MNESEIIKLMSILDDMALKELEEDTTKRAIDYCKHLRDQGLSSESALIGTIAKASHMSFRNSILFAIFLMSIDKSEWNQAMKELSQLIKSLN